jgi:hypothetical protein
MSDPNVNIQPPVGMANAVAGVQSEPEPKDRRFFWLSVGQYLVLGIIGVIFVYFLIAGVLGSDGKNIERLADHEIARGVITYLVAVATVAIATVLVMAAILGGGKDFERKFAMGKEVLTLLIGVLGTIIGFYYGSSTQKAEAARSAAVEVAPVKLTPETPSIGGTFNLATVIKGGTAPYTYTIRFDPANLVSPAVENQTSKDGKISHDLTVSKDATAGTPIKFVIDIKDAKNNRFEYNKDGQQQITLKAP